MKEYKNIISLSRNGRGIWDLDTIKGCESGLKENPTGCYGDCYAARTAKRYGINFGKSIERSFINESHKNKIVNQIEKIDMPFIRIGCSGDPSENWEHTINIINQIRNKKQLSLFDISSTKQIVIITRHWNVLSDEQLSELKKFNICINTSVSALDNDILLNKCLYQYKRLKPFCKSILRVVTCDFKDETKAEIQRKLLLNSNIIDTVFRPTKNNPLIINGIINVKRMAFMKNKTLVSKYNKKAYLGKCSTCLEMCGLSL